MAAASAAAPAMPKAGAVRTASFGLLSRWPGSPPRPAPAPAPCDTRVDAGHQRALPGQRLRSPKLAVLTAPAFGIAGAAADAAAIPCRVVTHKRCPPTPPSGVDNSSLAFPSTARLAPPT